MDIDWQALSEQCGVELHGASARPQTGGSISSAWRVDSDQGPVFMKIESVRYADRLEAEADGLLALRRACSIRVPALLAQGCVAGAAFLALEWIRPGRGDGAEVRLGERLAQQHRTTGAMFGWHRDNYLGATPQANLQGDDWVEFFREQRLAFQYRLAIANGHRLNEARMLQLLAGLGEFYSDYQPGISLLHGDLWGGNWFADEHEQPVVFDPAVYFGDREADLAMSELFGGFGPGFYAAYNAAWPLDPGYTVRRDLHKLYHVLNHLNLFGHGYFRQAASLLERLNSELT